eukprot:TRINITY_DN1219_c0_g1_i4.p1 TRINITY_DN1219_c0_g1~~TRINITY_DN1219_c0_g1_i4.p1  ORF type:complete len:150 (+),score=28.38 TRINITY_DN1219_c0_g1_i4:372-821(+)
MGQREVVKLSDGSYLCHAWSSPDGLVVTATTDGDYPSRVAFALLARAADTVKTARGPALASVAADVVPPEVPALRSLLLLYQDATSADQVERVKKDLDETNKIMVKTIEQLLERGDSLERLAERSEDLSFQSRHFVQSAQKLNSCCVLL